MNLKILEFESVWNVKKKLGKRKREIMKSWLNFVPFCLICVQNILLYANIEATQEASVFVTVNPFHPRLIFVGMSGLL
jgi:hypothetical protein